jgi:hypothetical protein
MTDFKGLTRRKLLQFAAAGAAAGGLLSQRRAVLAQTQEAIILPSESGRFENIELTYFQDSGWLHAPLWLSPIFMKDAGVGIKSRQQYEAGDAMNQVLPELLAEQPHFDWVQYPSPFFGTFAETGQLEPLDEYLMRYPSGKDYLDWVMPAYAEFYTRWNGKTYGVMLDGDIHVLHYRKSRFADPALQKKYSARFQRDLLVPKTWQEFIDCTQFFTEELSSQGIYGASTVIAPPAVGWSVWMNIAAWQWRELLRRRDESGDQYAARGPSLGSAQADRQVRAPGQGDDGRVASQPALAGWHGREWRSGGWISRSPPLSCKAPTWRKTKGSTSSPAGDRPTARSGTGRFQGGAGRHRSRRTRRSPSRTRPSTSSIGCPIRRCPIASWPIRTAAPSPSGPRTTPMRRPSSISSPIRSAMPTTSYGR